MKRQIVLDTETTGFDAEGEDRIVEIGAVEIINYLPSGKTFHKYINPERPIPVESSQIHGITDERVANEPVFSQIVDEFMAFIGDSELVIHNAEFDMRFINAELKRIGMKPLAMKQALDTLLIARKKFPGSPASLDALCRRFNIDNSNRTLHGALLDSELLAEVYLELIGGRQHGLILSEAKEEETVVIETSVEPRKTREQRTFPLSAEQEGAHNLYIGSFKETKWLIKKEAE